MAYAVPLESLGGEVRVRHLVRFSSKGQFVLPAARYRQLYAPEHQAIEAQPALGRVTVK
jgi:uncharacterized protein YfaS (alpha-2-macroglobulin family)